MTTCKTNTQPNSKQEVCYDCTNVWAKGQYAALFRVKSGMFKSYNILFQNGTRVQRRGYTVYQVNQNYAQRAYDIAAVYAKMYLGSGEFKEFPVLKNNSGLFYWMGLAAFASKTVGCALDNPWVKDPGGMVRQYTGLLRNLTPFLPPSHGIHNNTYIIDLMPQLSTQLAKGNVWLFLDVMPWHYVYAQNPAVFRQCLSKRKFDALPTVIKEDLGKVDGFEDTIEDRNMNFADSGKQYIQKAFSALDEALKLEESRKIAEKKILHLFYIAYHEQEIILQKIMYEGRVFPAYLSMSRMLEDKLPGLYAQLPQNELNLVATCKIKKGQERFQSKAPRGIELENLEQRMNWITKAATIYHKRMSRPSDKQFIENQLRILAARKRAGVGDHA
ncbi:DUF2515 family protein [Neisseria sicca]|nr:hypothetical protein [Neisseria sicca]QMT37705.1 hypothetical protein H3L95_11440 [Neisseria sicca]